MIYKEQFKNQNLAKLRLERLTRLQPKEALILPINWHLYQIYNSLEDAEMTEKYKNVILTQFAGTKFAQVILNPEEKIAEEVAVDEVEKVYKEVYYLYKANKFEEVISKISKYVAKVPGSTLVPKFELLKAFAIGKYQDPQAYKIALDFVAVSYGSTEEGKKAKAILKQLEK